jgi:hypothetical protein
LVVPSATTHYSFFEVNFSTHGLRKIVSPETESITLALDGIPVTSTNEELSDKAYNSCLRASANVDSAFVISESHRIQLGQFCRYSTPAQSANRKGFVAERCRRQRDVSEGLSFRQ